MGSERGKKTRVSQDRTIRRVEREKKKKKEKTNGGRRGCETTMRNYAIDPVKESHESGSYYEDRCSINRLESGTAQDFHFRGSSVVGGWPIWKRKGRPLVSRMLVSRGIWTAAAACGNSGRPRWKSQGGASPSGCGKTCGPLSFYETAPSLNEIREF